MIISPAFAIVNLVKTWIKRTWWIVPLAAATYAGAFFVSPAAKNVPAEFSEARINGARTAEKIVAASAYSLQILAKIAEHDRAGNATDALTLVSKELIKAEEIRGEALFLASRLERMARLLSEIQPTRARVLATEAVSSEVALVSRLLSYNEYLTELFETLRAKFQNRLTNTDGKVGELVQKINEEGKAINEFDRKFNQSLAEFDKIFSGN